MATPTFAQERQDSHNEEIYPQRHEASQFQEDGANKEAMKDSVAVKPLVSHAKPDTPAPKNKKEEDPLSFNFLYFIIQRFKASDVTD